MHMAMHSDLILPSTQGSQCDIRHMIPIQWAMMMSALVSLTLSSSRNRGPKWPRKDEKYPAVEGLFSISSIVLTTCSGLK